jgi:hypothetical protein
MGAAVSRAEASLSIGKIEGAISIVAGVADPDIGLSAYRPIGLGGFARTALIIDGIVGRKHNADSRAWDGLLADPVTRARTLAGIAKACSWSGKHALRWASKDAGAMSRQNIRAHDVIDLYPGSAYGCALILVELARVATNAGYKQWASELLGITVAVSR